MLERLVEPLEPPHAARRHPFVSDGTEMTIALGLVQDLEEERACLAGPFVQPNARENHERSRAEKPWQEWRNEVSELCLGPPRVAGFEVQVRGLHRPTHRIVPTGRGCQLLRAVEKERGGSGRPTPPRMVGRALDDGCHRLVGLVDRRRQLPRPGFGILEQLREPHVDLVAAKRVARLVRTRGEQRMREADPTSVELDEAGVRVQAPGRPRARLPKPLPSLQWSGARVPKRRAGSHGSPAGSARSLPRTRSCSDSGTGRGWPASIETSERWSMRTISSA